MENEFSEWMVVKDRIHKGGVLSRNFQKAKSGGRHLVKMLA